VIFPFFQRDFESVRRRGDSRDWFCIRKSTGVEENERSPARRRCAGWFCLAFGLDDRQENAPCAASGAPGEFFATSCPIGITPPRASQLTCTARLFDLRLAIELPPPLLDRINPSEIFGRAGIGASFFHSTGGAMYQSVIVL